MKNLIKSILREEIEGLNDGRLKSILSRLHKMFNISAEYEIKGFAPDIIKKAEHYVPNNGGKVYGYLLSNFREDGDYTQIETLVEPKKITYVVSVPETISEIQYVTTDYAVEAWSESAAIRVANEEGGEWLEQYNEDYGDRDTLHQDWDEAEAEVEIDTNK